MPRAQQSKRYRSQRRGKPARKAGQAFSPDIPVAGFYRMRLRRGAVPVALQFWLGAPLDPDTGEELDRVARWQCRVNGTELVPVDRFWPQCARDPISREEFSALCELNRTLDPASPYYDHLKPIDRLKTPLPFGKET